VVSNLIEDSMLRKSESPPRLLEYSKKPRREGTVPSRAAAAEAGRDRKMATFLECSRKGITVTTAAKEVGVNRWTVYNWRETCPEFAALWDEAKEQGCDHVEDIILKHAQKDWRAAESWLRANRREKWGNRQKNEASELNADPSEQISRIEIVVVDSPHKLAPHGLASINAVGRLPDT
jgi:hypothetical protein